LTLTIVLNNFLSNKSGWQDLKINSTFNLNARSTKSGLMLKLRSCKVGFALGVIAGCIISLAAYSQLSNAAKTLLEKGRSKSNNIGIISSTDNRSSITLSEWQTSPNKIETNTPLPRIRLNTTVDRRPARIPPDWLKAGHCMNDMDDETAADILSATGMVHEERTGDTLLGRCSCPLRDMPSDWKFDCADYDWRILR
jgi:hypothetical protein